MEPQQILAESVFSESDHRGSGALLTEEYAAEVGGTMPTTLQSMGYRKRASDLARLADREANLPDRLKLVKEALDWISLAENDEFIAEAERHPEKP
jgi:hypothetical protein